MAGLVTAVYGVAVLVCARAVKRPDETRGAGGSAASVALIEADRTRLLFAGGTCVMAGVATVAAVARHRYRR